MEVKSFVTTTPVHKMETEDLVAAAVRFKSGAIGMVHATTAAYPGFPERIELIGTRGTALLEGTSLKLQIHDEQPFEFKTEAGGGGPARTRWPSRTTGTAACWRISWIPSSGTASPGSAAPRR